MSPQQFPVKFTYEDFLLFPDDGRRHELIEGDHYVTPSPNTKHQRVIVNLGNLLFSFVKARRLGTVLYAPCDVVFSDLDVVEPDILFVSASRQHIITEKNIQGAPDLVIEVLSDSSRRTDELIKKKLYEKYDVSEYWIVDPLLESLKMYRRTSAASGAAGGYARAVEYEPQSADPVTTPLFPGLEILLPQLFE